MELTDWQLACSGPGRFETPADALAGLDDWLTATVPGTVAGALRNAGRWSFDDVVDFDAADWWLTTTFAAEPGRALLELDGVATIADVWLNDEHLLRSETMFVAHALDVDLLATNTLAVCCRSLSQFLTGRRPRPRWKTRIVEQQQLRWVRTTLLGRMPSWTPPAAPVGLWRPVRVIRHGPPRVDVARLAVTPGDATTAVIDVDVAIAAAEPVRGATLHWPDGSTALELDADRGALRARGRGVTERLARWWPHTHGTPALHELRLEIELADRVEHVSLGKFGVRSIEVDERDGAFALSVNGVPVFCRGACWVPVDVVSLQATDDELRGALVQMRDAGMNMVRLIGPLVYETELFHQMCDELGILVWQDLMFANMDYPTGDEGFVATTATEIGQVLGRLARHPSTTVICGGSEVEQQAVMMGFADPAAANPLGRTLVGDAAAALAPGVPYVPSSPTGGTYPFATDTSVSHYYGVGAYLRPLSDARLSRVRFTSECLAFSNVPSRASVEAFLRDGERPGHSPRWKARVPRDRGSGWDFEDVRDHYVRSTFDVEPPTVRYSDPERYLDLGRAATAATLEATMAELRHEGSPCRGALVFLQRDLWPGAGWGLVDAAGEPKSVYWAVRRACQPVAVLVTDEGLNGVVAHVVNDTPQRITGVLRAAVFGLDDLIAEAPVEIDVGPASSAALSVDAIFGEFRDLNFSYRFGPSRYEGLRLELIDGEQQIAETAHLLRGPGQVPAPRRGPTAAFVVEDGQVFVDVHASELCPFVSLDVDGGRCADNWFHLMPRQRRRIACEVTGPRLRGEVRALDCPAGASSILAPDPGRSSS